MFRVRLNCCFAQNLVPMRLRTLLLTITAFTFAFLSFDSPAPLYNEPVATYYDAQLDTLLIQLKSFKQAVGQKKQLPVLQQHFFNSRYTYKKVAFFTEQFDSRGARMVNGPDLLRIEDDTQNDSVKPHGFQHIETILYDAPVDMKLLQQEITIQINNVQSLRNAPDHQYYFRDDRIWEAMRSGMYRIISMGITGFDVPICLNAIPETKVQLQAQKHIVQLYKIQIEQADKELYTNIVKAFDNAIAYIKPGTGFNSFNRLVFTKDYINPLSAYLKQIAYQLHFVNTNQLTPLNPEADNLFDKNVFNLAFFSPNERYSVTPERVALGKRLFYDTKLSVNNSRSCASCHKPEMAFADGLVRAKNIDGVHDILRNTPTLLNSVYQARQFYDSRALVLETQLDAVVHSKEEMGGSLGDAIPVLEKDNGYNAMFLQAYPNEKNKITHYTIANAIASYIRTLVSFNSRFDRYMRGEADSFSVSEQNGFNLFMGKAKCGTCHYAPMFNNLVPPRYEESESEILAVPATNTPRAKLDGDEGKFMHTKVPLHKYAFKTPTVRNAALTAPYMHNGVFRTLEEVIEFYNKGGGAGVGIELNTQTLPADKLNLSKQEVKDLAAFITSLNDVPKQ